MQLSLPIYRQKSPFKGLTLVAASTKSSELRAGGDHVDLLNPITINDKIGTVSLFFEWAKTRDSSVANPVAVLPPAPGLPYAPLRPAQPLAEHGRILT